MIVVLPFMLVRAIGAVIALGVMVVIGRHPARAIAALLILVPFQMEIFAFLYRIGVPGEFVRPLGQWKEIVVLGLLAAGALKAVREQHRLDRLDIVGLAYVGLGTAYFLVPFLFLEPGEVGRSLDFTTRLLGWRTDILYVALFLACRHLRLGPEVVGRLVRTFVATAAVVGSIAILEFLFPSTWNTLLIEHLRLHEYKMNVLNVRPADDPWLFDVRVYTSVGGRQVHRVGSVLTYYWALGFYMVIASAVIADRIVRGAARPLSYLLLFLTAGSLLLTQTRSAILGLAVVLFVTLLRRPGRLPRSAESRTRFAIVLGAVVVLAIPAAAAVGLVDRFQGEDDYSSNEVHRDNFEQGMTILSDNPLGRGLATAAGAGQAADVAGTAVSESQYLQIGTQLGILGLALWLGTVILTIVALGRANARAPAGVDPGLVTATRTALFGLLAAGFFLQPFIEYAVTWSVWSLAGVALGMLESTGRGIDEPAPVSELVAAR